MKICLIILNSTKTDYTAVTCPCMISKYIHFYHIVFLPETLVRFPNCVKLFKSNLPLNYTLETYKISNNFSFVGDYFFSRICVGDEIWNLKESLYCNYHSAHSIEDDWHISFYSSQLQLTYWYKSGFYGRWIDFRILKRHETLNWFITAFILWTLKTIKKHTYFTGIFLWT